MALRAELVAHMRQERGLYEPFVEDDETFDAYLERMARDGTWAGQMEVQALVRARGVGVCIHQAGLPPWVVEAEGAKTRGAYLHVTYEDEQHYNSVRCAKGSDAGGPGGPKPLPGDAPPPPPPDDGDDGDGAEERAQETPAAPPPAEPAARPVKLSARERAEAKRAAKAAKAAARQRLAAGPSRDDGDGGGDALSTPLAALRL